MFKNSKAMAGAVVLAFASVGAVAIVPAVAAAQTASQVSALVKAIDDAAAAVKGSGPKADADRQKAVEDAISGFLLQNGIDPAVAPALIQQAKAQVQSSSVYGQGGVPAAFDTAQNVAQKAATDQSASGSAGSTGSSGTTGGTNGGSTGSGAGGSGGGGGGGGVPYGTQPS